MSMFDVRYNNERQWLAYADPDAMRVYAYVPNLDRFVFHRALTHEFYRADDDTTFAAIADTDAATLIADPAALPRLDGRRHSHLLDGLAAESDTRTPAELLRSYSAPVSPTAREAAAAKAQALRNSQPGTWMIWKTYPADDRHKALVAVRDLLKGKVKAVADLNVNVRVGDLRNDRWPVLITTETTPAKRIVAPRQRPAKKPAADPDRGISTRNAPSAKALPRERRADAKSQPTPAVSRQTHR